MTRRITPIVMPKWGLSMKEGSSRAGIVAGRQTIKPGDEILEVETDKIAGASRRPMAGCCAAASARSGRSIRSRRCSASCAEPEVRDAEIDAYVAAYEVPAPEDGEEGRDHPTEFVETRRGRLRYAQRGRAAIRSCSSTASAAISTTGCSMSTPSPRPGRSMRSTCPAMAVRRRRSPIPRSDALADAVGAVHGRAQARARQSRRPFDGRRGRRPCRAAPPRAGPLAHPDQPARARRADQWRAISTASSPRNRAAISSRCSRSCSPTRTWSAGKWSTIC